MLPKGPRPFNSRRVHSGKMDIPHPEYDFAFIGHMSEINSRYSNFLGPRGQDFGVDTHSSQPYDVARLSRPQSVGP